MTSHEVLYTVPRARLADSLRAIASAICGGISLWVGVRQPWVLPLGIVLVGYVAFLGIKLRDPRPAFVATTKGLTIFRFPGESWFVLWERLEEVLYLRMRVKRVMFFKLAVHDGGGSTAATLEVPSTDFSGKGAEIAARLTELRDRYA